MPDTDPLVIIPVLGDIVVAVATVVGVADHVPPDVMSLSVIVAPSGHKLLAPVIPAGKGLTVTTAVAGEPQPSLYIIVVVPVATVETIPFDAPIVATVVVLLVHVPPFGLSDKVILLPMHTAPGPLIAPGAAITVTTKVAAEHPPAAYAIVAVPLATPVTTPPATVATVVLELLHVPPVVASVKLIVDPTQTLCGPVIGNVPLTVIVTSGEYRVSTPAVPVLVVATRK